MIWLISAPPATADPLHVATAANFKPALEHLLEDFDRARAHTIRISSASTGTLYAQAVHGAPFDVLLAADSARPRQLEENGYAVTGSRITYALGQMVLVYQPEMSSAAAAGLVHILTLPGLSLVIANPELAPYGQAAAQVLGRPELQVPNRTLLRASNVLQAYQMWFSGGADIALVSKSLASDNYLPVPSQWHAALEQQAVLMQTAADKPLALELLRYLQSVPAQKIIREHGYLSPEPSSHG